MAVWTMIKVSELEGAKRLDAEYYHPKYAKVIHNLHALGAIPLSHVVEPARRKFKPTTGQPFPYVEISEVNTSTGNINAVTLSGSDPPDRAQWIVRERDVIISTVRPIRNAVAVISNREDGFVCSSGFAVLKTKEVSPEFLFTFLKSRPIVELIDRKTTATMYPAVSWQDVLTIPIFKPDRKLEQFIIGRVAQAQVELEHSESLYLQAEQKVLDEIGWNKLDLSQPKWWTVPSSKTQQVHRLDAEHFQPKYEMLSAHLKKNRRVRLLGEIAPFINHGPQPPYSECREIPIITQGQMERFMLNLDSVGEFTTRAFWESKRKFQVRNRDVLIYSVGAYLGRTNLYLSNQPAMTGSYITVVRPDATQCLPEYMAVYLNALPAQMQFKKWSRASGQPYIYPSDIAQLEIYCASRDVQAKVANLVHQSYTAHQKAKELLESAKAKVEDLIQGHNSDGNSRN